MPRIVVSGGPGVGKTTMLRELAAMGYAVIDESARELIRERLALGQSPRPAPHEFAAELIRRDRRKYERTNSGAEPVFFDRCLVESVAMGVESGLMSESEVQAELSSVAFDRRVFILPPWREIYVNDAERDHTFEHCQRVHAGLGSWYTRCGYTVVEVPRASPRRRAEHVLQALADGAA